MNIVSVAAAPFYAVFLFWFFRRRGRNGAEIMVAYILYAAFGNLVSTIIFSPILSALRNSNSYYYVQVSSFILQTAYMAWGMRDFFGYKGLRGFLKLMAALSVVGIIGFILLLVAYFLYVFYGSYEVLQYI